MGEKVGIAGIMSILLFCPYMVFRCHRVRCMMGISQPAMLIIWKFHYNEGKDR
jgi:hypothetical protein